MVENGNGVRLMKKLGYIILGMIVGFCLSFAVGAQAESLINSVVQGVFPVTIEGKKLETEAVVINGSTYLPVRSFGEATGYRVGFDADLGVNMTRKTTTESGTVTTGQTKKEDKVKVTNPILVEDQTVTNEQVEELIKKKKADIWSMNAVIVTDGEKNPNFQTYKDRLATYESELADLEKQKAELNK